jgi:serine/threonine protein kinase
MGRVLGAFDLTLDPEVALKVLLPGAHADRFVRESKITARLPHPGIPPVHALGTLADGSPFLAMKLGAGPSERMARSGEGSKGRLLYNPASVNRAIAAAAGNGPSATPSASEVRP